MIIARASIAARPRPGITLVEILIAILILGVGLTSLATLFPIGLLRLREAARSTRSAYLMESAAADVAARGLLSSSSFQYADQFNLNYGLPTWYWVPANSSSGNTTPYSYDPLIMDTAYYTDDPKDPNNPGVTAPSAGGYGLPFAYDPLWRFQTVNPSTGLNGYYLDSINATTLEARFGAGIGFIQQDADGNIPSAHGLQRLTNFNRPYVPNGNNPVTPIMPVASTVPTIFVSPEDVVWQEANNNNYKMQYTGNPIASPSPVLPDMSIATDLNSNPTSVNDWHYSWMFTGQQNNGSAGSSFEGNIVIFENRVFGINVPSFVPGPVTGQAGNTFPAYQVDGEIVVEAIYGYSTKLVSPSGQPPGFGVSADRAVLLRWYASEPDPVVRVGDWFADVTYERNQTVVASRFSVYPQYVYDYTNKTWVPSNPTQYGGLQNIYNNYEWDGFPAQRCFWYRVQKVQPATVDANLAGMRSMVVYVDRSLQARTMLNSAGTPAVRNAALICPSVVNVIPQTIFTK